MLHINLLIGLFAGPINGSAVLPLHLTAEHRLQPVVHHVLKVFPEVKVVFSSKRSLLVTEGPFADSELVLVLIKAGNEECQEANDDSVKPSNVR